MKVFFLLFLFFFNLSFAQENTGTLAINGSKTPSLTGETLRQWRENFFESDEVWPILNRESFITWLLQNGLDESLVMQLRLGFKYSLGDVHQAQALIAWDIKNIEGFLTVNEALKAKLSKEVLTAAYTYLLSTGQNIRFFSYDHLEQAKYAFENAGVEGESLNFLLDHVYKINEKYYYFFTKDTWSALKPTLKMSLINSFLQADVYNSGLKLTLTIDQDSDLASIAKQFAGSRDPKLLQRYLERLLKKNHYEKLMIPLETILNPYIRKNLNTYALCNGPNCFNAAYNANEGNHFETNFLSREDLITSLCKKYRFVRPDEQLKTDDIMVYQTLDNKMVHAASYVGVIEGKSVVSTKNGLWKISPTIFQTKKDNEKIYFPDGNYQLFVFRIPQAGEQVISETGKKLGKSIFYEVSKVAKNPFPRSCKYFFN